MTLQVEVAPLGAPGRTFLLDPCSLLLGEMVWNRELLPRQAQRTRIGDHKGANHMRGVGGTKPTTDAGANVPTMGAISRVAQPCHQVRERRCGPPELPPGLPYRSGNPKPGNDGITRSKASSGLPRETGDHSVGRSGQRTPLPTTGTHG